MSRYQRIDLASKILVETFQRNDADYNFGGSITSKSCSRENFGIDCSEFVHSVYKIVDSKSPFSTSDHTASKYATEYPLASTNYDIGSDNWERDALRIIPEGASVILAYEKPKSVKGRHTGHTFLVFRRIPMTGYS